MSNFETLSQNEESTLYKLENELFNLETENESYKKQLQELEKYKFESSETKVSRKEKDKDKLSPLKEAFEENSFNKGSISWIKWAEIINQRIGKFKNPSGTNNFK